MIIALDQSTTALGWCILDPGKGERYAGSGVFKPKGDIEDRILKCEEWVENLLRENLSGAFVGGRQDVLALEAPFLGPNARSNVRTNAHLGELRGRLAATGRLVGYEVYMVKPTDWQHSAGIKRMPRADRQQASIRYASLVTGKAITSHDEADAVCIAFHIFGQLRILRAAS